MRRRHRYVTVIVSGDTGELLAMVPHRSAEALSRFFAAQGHRWCAGVKVVVTDGSKAYRAAVDRHLGHATHVLDRFHVIGWFAAGLVAVRRDVQRRQPAGATPVFDAEVFRCAGSCCCAAPTASTTPNAPNSKPLFEAHPRLRAAWEALGELHGLYLADDKAGALTALDRFTDLYQTGDLPEFYKIVNTLHRSHAPASSPGTPPGGPATAASKAPTTSSKSYAAAPTASPTPTTSPPAHSS